MGARWLYMLPALILSVVAVALALLGLARDPAPSGDGASSAVTQVTEEQIADALKFSYWVATRELSVGDTIEEEDFRKVGVSAPLSAAVTADTPITNQLLRRDLREGEILAESHLEVSNRLAQAVPPDFRAFAVAIDDTSAVGGLLEPGDLVDVLAHFKKGEDKEPTALVLLDGVEVLAVKGRLQDAPAEDERAQTRNRNSTVVLAVPREELPRLLLADSNGELRLVMAGEAVQQDPAEVPDGEEQIAEKASEQGDIKMTTKLDTLFPQKTQPVRRSAPRGNRVQVYEGSTSRSTYVR